MTDVVTWPWCPGFTSGCFALSGSKPHECQDVACFPFVSVQHYWWKEAGLRYTNWHVVKVSFVVSAPLHAARLGGAPSLCQHLEGWAWLPHWRETNRSCQKGVSVTGSCQNRCHRFPQEENKYRSWNDSFAAWQLPQRRGGLKCGLIAEQGYQLPESRLWEIPLKLPYDYRTKKNCYYQSYCLRTKLC